MAEKITRRENCGDGEEEQVVVKIKWHEQRHRGEGRGDERVDHIGA